MNDRIDPIDPITAAVAIASILFGPTMSAIIGPYAIIIVGSTVGASWALGRRQTAPKFGAAWFFLRINMTACLLTVMLARLVGQTIGVDEHSWLLAPTAIFVGGVGDDWPRIAKWLILRIGRAFDHRMGLDKDKDGG